MSTSNKPQAHGRHWQEFLSPAQAAVAEQVARGLSGPEAAKALHLSISTIKFHLADIYRALDIGSRTQLVRWWIYNVELKEEES